MVKFILFYSLLLFVSCDNSKKCIEHALETVDSVSVVIYADTGRGFDMKTYSFSFNDPDSITMAKACISKIESPNFFCWYSGEIHLFSNGELVLDTMRFNLCEECKYIAFTCEDKYLSRRLTPFGFNWLRSIQNRIPSEMHYCGEKIEKTR